MPVAICDNQVFNQDDTIEGIPIISFEQALELFSDMYVVITSRNYGNIIKEQVVEFLEENRVINIEPFFDSKPFYLKEKLKKYSAILRGEATGVVPLLTPNDLPTSIQKELDTLESYMECYQRGEKREIVVDEYFIKSKKNVICDFWTDSLIEEIVISVDLTKFMNQKCYKGQQKVGPNDSHLLPSSFMNPVIQEVKSAVNKVVNFNDYLEKKKITFLYVQLPYKISPNETNLPPNGENHLNQKATKFVEGLMEQGVAVLDYRQTMIEQEIDYWDSFFKTDNHWKPSVAFYATKEVCLKLEELTGMEFQKDLFDLENYDIVVYPDIFLGNMGKQVGLLYGGVDDFELIIPKYPTEYTWSCARKGFEKRGEAKESLLNTPQLDWAYFHLSSYGIYSLKYRGHCKIVNHKANYERKIIVICDSYTNPMASFLAPHFSELHFMDLRGDLTKEDLMQLIEEVQPDIVTMMLYVGTISRGNGSSTDVNPYE